VPAGTPITARIVEHDSTHAQAKEGIVLMVHLIFRIETMTVAGTTYRFVATTAQAIESADPFDRSAVSGYLRDPTVGGLLLSPNTALLKFYGVKSDFVLKAGHQSKWTTGGTGPTSGCLSGANRCK